MPVDGLCPQNFKSNDRFSWHGGGHFAYVVKSHIKNAVKSIIRAIFAYTAFTPFRVGMGELTSFLWRNGGQITAYRWYRQRAEKSYFFLLLSIAQIQTHCNKKSASVLHTPRRKKANTGTEPIITYSFMIISPVLGFAYPFYKER